MGTPHLQTGVSPARGIVKRLKDLIFLCDYRSVFDMSDGAIDRIVDTLKKKNQVSVWIRFKYLFDCKTCTE